MECFMLLLKASAPRLMPSAKSSCKQFCLRTILLLHKHPIEAQPDNKMKTHAHTLYTGLAATKTPSVVSVEASASQGKVSVSCVDYPQHASGLIEKAPTPKPLSKAFLNANPPRPFSGNTSESTVSERPRGLRVCTSDESVHISEIGWQICLSQQTPEVHLQLQCVRIASLTTSTPMPASLPPAMRSS